MYSPARASEPLRLLVRTTFSARSSYTISAVAACSSETSPLCAFLQPENTRPRTAIMRGGGGGVGAQCRSWAPDYTVHIPVSVRRACASHFCRDTCNNLEFRARVACSMLLAQSTYALTELAAFSATLLVVLATVGIALAISILYFKTEYASFLFCVRCTRTSFQLQLHSYMSQ